SHHPLRPPRGGLLWARLVPAAPGPLRGLPRRLDPASPRSELPALQGLPVRGRHLADLERVSILHVLEELVVDPNHSFPRELARVAHGNRRSAARLRQRAGELRG